MTISRDTLPIESKIELENLCSLGTGSIHEWTDQEKSQTVSIETKAELATD